MSNNELTQSNFVDATLAELRKQGLDYGSYFKMDLLKEMAGPFGKDPVKFAFFKIELSSRLIQLGFHISEANLNGEGMRICQAVENFHIATGWLGRADAAHNRAHLLLEKTDQTRLTEAEKQRDSNLLREIQHRRLMLSRLGEIVKIVKKHRPGLLKEDQEIEIQDTNVCGATNKL
jgi:hypothetical protein